PHDSGAQLEKATAGRGRPRPRRHSVNGWFPGTRPSPLRSRLSMVGMSFQNAATLALSQRMLRDSKGQNQDQRRVTIGQRWQVGRAVPSAPSYELALGEPSWIYTEETPGWTTKPECARPRAQ